MSEQCYFCECDAMRSDNLRKHCKAVHRAEQVVDKVLANGLKFRRDTDRPSLLIALKNEGSSETCGFCFDCQTKISVLRGAKNPIAAVQRHQCREIKERVKKVVPVGGAGSTVSAPVSHRVGEKEMDELRKTLKTHLEFEFITNEDHSYDMKKTLSNLAVAIKKQSAELKEAKVAEPTQSWQSIQTKIVDAFTIKYPRRAVALKAQVAADYMSAIECIDSDNEGGIDDEGAATKWILDIVKMALNGGTSTMPIITATDLNLLKQEVATSKEEAEQLTMANGDLLRQLRIAQENVVGGCKDLQTAQQRIRLLEAHLTAQAEKIEHLTTTSPQ